MCEGMEPFSILWDSRLQEEDEFLLHSFDSTYQPELDPEWEKIITPDHLLHQSDETPLPEEVTTITHLLYPSTPSQGLYSNSFTQQVHHVSQTTRHVMYSSQRMGWIPNVHEVLSQTPPQQHCIITRKEYFTPFLRITNPVYHRRFRSNDNICATCLRCGEGITRSTLMLHCIDCNHFQVMYRERYYNALWCHSRKLVALESSERNFGITCECIGHQGLLLVPPSAVKIVIGNVIYTIR